MIVQVDKFSGAGPGVYAAATGSIRLESLFLTLPTRALTGRMSLCRSTWGHVPSPMREAAARKAKENLVKGREFGYQARMAKRNAQREPRAL
jgi:hypothetical protein